jgi:hypothetical protein
MYFLQLLQAEAGILNANDAQAAGSESSELATGLIQIQESGDELFQPTLDDLKPGLRAVLSREVDVTLANLNPKEAFDYFDGQTDGMDTITPEDVRGLKFKVKIALNKKDDQKRIQLSAAACGLVERFYLLSPIVQEKVAPLYRDQVRRLVPNIDVNSIIQPIPPTGPEQQAPKKAISLTVKGEQLTPEQLDEALRENFDVQSTGSQPLKTQETGSVEKLGERAPATEFSAQLSQRIRKKAAPAG